MQDDTVRGLLPIALNVDQWKLAIRAINDRYRNKADQGLSGHTQ